MYRLLFLHYRTRLGQPIDLYEHGVQTASRALRAGESDELVVVSLLHDISETIASKNHGSVVAALLEPYISEEAQWLLRQHEVFQGECFKTTVTLRAKTAHNLTRSPCTCYFVSREVLLPPLRRGSRHRAQVVGGARLLRRHRAVV